MCSRFKCVLRLQDLLSYAMILLPPLAVAILNPTIFYSALENAGTFGICVLFGIFPAIMAGIVRLQNKGDPNYVKLVPGRSSLVLLADQGGMARLSMPPTAGAGGRYVLLAIVAGAAAVIGQGIYDKLA
jgi:hypothetical protein